jgi:hypothetical protein
MNYCVVLVPGCWSLVDGKVEILSVILQIPKEAVLIVGPSIFYSIVAK